MKLRSFKKRKVFEFVRNGHSNIILQEKCLFWLELVLPNWFLCYYFYPFVIVLYELIEFY